MSMPPPCQPHASPSHEYAPIISAGLWSGGRVPHHRREVRVADLQRLGECETKCGGECGTWCGALVVWGGRLERHALSAYPHPLLSGQGGGGPQPCASSPSPPCRISWGQIPTVCLLTFPSPQDKAGADPNRVGAANNPLLEGSGNLSTVIGMGGKVQGWRNASFRV